MNVLLASIEERINYHSFYGNTQTVLVLQQALAALKEKT